MGTRNPRGFSLVELMIGAGILSVALLVVANSGMFMTRFLSNKEVVFLRAQQLEQQLVESLQDHNNFSFELRNRLRDGASFDAFELKFVTTVELKDDSVAKSKNRDIETKFFIPKAAAKLSEVKPSIAFYDVEGRYCGTKESSECPIRIAIAMIQVAGTYDFFTYGGKVDYLEEDSRKDQSTIPIYALAYRIMVPAPEFNPLRAPANEDEKEMRSFISIGASAVKPEDVGKFEFNDFSTVLPGDVYLEVGGNWKCQDGSLVRGIDPFYQSPVCLKMGSRCVKGEIGKQLQISGNTLYVDCVPFKKYECDDKEYVISWISPKYLDSDYSGTASPGQCVYKGVRKARQTFENRKRVQKRCGSKYTMDVKCDAKVRILSMCVSPPDGEGNVMTQSPSVPSPGSSKSKGGTNLYNCDITNDDPPGPACPAGWSGGDYEVYVEMDVTCELRPEDEFRPLKGL